MSLVKAANVQIGTGPSASNNFHWRNLLDGLLRLSRGNAGSPITDVMLVRADNSVEFPGGVAGVIGQGQTWQNVTSSRVAGTNYTNTTGKPIMITVYATQNVGSLTDILVNGVVAARAQASTSGEGVNVAAIVPPGSVYSVSAGNTLSYWAELR